MKVVKPAGAISVNSYGSNCRCICSTTSGHDNAYYGTYYNVAPCTCQCSYGTENQNANYSISYTR